jgi:glycosyltransferase involved in cell wall biosynthesis
MPEFPISVIVPVYNDEKNLPRCIESILSQTFENFECLIIDDGSTDNCPGLCEGYAKKDKRVRVFHKANEGISKTRQFGLNHSKGSYIFFIDSDDWIVPSCFDNIYQTIKDENTDLAYINFYNETFNGKQKICIQRPCIDDTDKVIKQVIKGELFSCLWNIVLKRDFYINNKLGFNETVNYGEDSLFILEALFYKPKIKETNGVLYHHTFNKYSFTQKNKKAKFIERIKFIEQLNLLLEKYDGGDLKKYNFIPINDKYEMLISGMFSKKEYHKLFAINISLGYLKQYGIYKYILLSLAETSLYYFARFISYNTRKIINGLRK